MAVLVEGYTPSGRQVIAAGKPQPDEPAPSPPKAKSAISHQRQIDDPQALG